MISWYWGMSYPRIMNIWFGFSLRLSASLDGLVELIHWDWIFVEWVYVQWREFFPIFFFLLRESSNAECIVGSAEWNIPYLETVNIPTSTILLPTHWIQHVRSYDIWFIPNWCLSRFMSSWCPLILVLME